jgi:hypothetical protein
MKKLFVGAVVVVAAVAAGVAYSAASPSAKLNKQDRVWGGGIAAASATPTNLVCAQNDPSVCIPSPRNFAVDAHAEGNGSQAVGNSAYGQQTSRTVTCENVAGNMAAIGGVIVASVDPSLVGTGYVQFFVDRGTTRPGDPLRDYMGLSLFGPVNDPTFPVGFPYVCPPAGGSPTLPAIYFQMDGGGVTVQDAPSS